MPRRDQHRYRLALFWIHGDDEFFVIRVREPIFGGRFDVPNISRNFKFQSDMENFAIGAGPLNPDDSSGEQARTRSTLAGADFDGERGTFRDVMLRLILAAVAVDGNGGGEFLELLAQCVHTPYGDRHGVNDSCTATVFCTTFVAGC